MKKKGDKIHGPCLIRRMYKREWEYAILNPDDTYNPFGRIAPSSIIWVYQVTWKGTKLQKIHVLKPEEKQWPDCIGNKETKCWWINSEYGRNLFAAAAGPHMKAPGFDETSMDWQDIAQGYREGASQ